MDELILATNNEHKVKEFKELFPHMKIQSLKEAHIVSNPEETGTTFLENAKIKAISASLQTSQLVIADDSGLEIEALNGFPGVFSARFMEGATSKEKCLGILQKLQGQTNRNAQFRCSLVVAKQGQILFAVDEVCPGVIATSIEGENGFGYDPIFIESSTGICFAKMSSEEKNLYSHRGKACRKLKDYFREETR